MDICEYLLLTGAEQQQKSHLLFFKTIDNKDIPLPKVRGPVWQAFVAASGKKLASSKTLQPLRRPMSTANATTTSRSWTQLSTIEKQNNVSYNQQQRNNNPFLRESSSEESLDRAMAMASSSKAVVQEASKSETTRTIMQDEDNVNDNEEDIVPVAAEKSRSSPPCRPPAIIRTMSAPLATEDSGLVSSSIYSINVI